MAVADPRLAESQARIDRARARGAYRTPEALEEGKGLSAAALLGETVASYLLMIFGLGAIIAVNEGPGARRRTRWRSRSPGATPCWW